MKTKTKVYGYARVSTKEQNEDRQLISLMQANVKLENIYIDKLSGKDFERPMYKELLAKLDENSILYVQSIDRLGRSYRDLSEQWRLITKVKKADVVVLDMPILDTRKDKNLLGMFISDLILCLLSYVAQCEFETIHKRQEEGIRAAKARGVKFGRPMKSMPDEYDEVMELWRLGSISMSEAARRLNVPLSTLRYRVQKENS